MSLSRFSALETILNRHSFEKEVVDIPAQKISSFFGANVFNDAAMREYLPEEAYLNVKAAIHAGIKLSREDANVVANAMKKWAMDKGATHYAHWFQPLTGRTAEKHYSFFTRTPEGSVIEEFGGNELSQQEPDGSSFPAGGLRSTFEARGYTAWDPSSPAFVLEVGEGRTLCIPTIFVTYSGDSLDYKLPLLKSQAYLEKAAIAVCQLFDKEVIRVTTTLGWEQEFFVVDEALFNSRPDLMLTGRTLLGKHSPKGQQLDDHYFGAMPERIYTFLRDLETECHRLGIPIRTRNNEMGPGQYGLAPVSEEVNVAVDHNQLLMDVMGRIAHRHKLQVLLHEKPFTGINGSGKCHNWSIITNTSRNLLSPGKVPGKNLEFLTFFVNTIQAVYKYADLLRASVATAANDHRLSVDDAPPTIVSVFIGQTMTKVLNDIEAGIEANAAGVKQVLDLLGKIPNLLQDNTDRNRTSPLAFTGDKFENRMVGASQSCAASMTVMNTIVGRQLIEFKSEVDQLIKKGNKVEAAILTVLKRYIKESKPIRFEGDSYSESWKKEAIRRGLSHTLNTPDALGAYLSKQSRKLFVESGVFNERELEAHYEVMCEYYVLKQQIESRTLGEMVINHILPAAFNYQSMLLNNIERMKQIDLSEEFYQTQLDIVRRISENINQIKIGVDKMADARRKANAHKQVIERAKGYCFKVMPLMDSIRLYTDRLEYLVDDCQWPLVKYRELMFVQ